MATAKKSTAKKSTAKQKSDVQSDEAAEAAEAAAQEKEDERQSKLPQPVSEDQEGLSLEEVAKQAAAGKWNTGRERDDRLRAKGYDPEEVVHEMARQRSES